MAKVYAGVTAVDGSVKGININGIKKLTTALNDYKTAIKKPYVGVNAEVIGKYLKGNAAKTELVKYSQKLDKEVSNMVKLLDTLTTSLQQVEAAYKKQDESAASTIASHSNKLKS